MSEYQAESVNRPVIAFVETKGTDGSEVKTPFSIVEQLTGANGCYVCGCAKASVIRIHYGRCVKTEYGVMYSFHFQVCRPCASDILDGARDIMGNVMRFLKDG